MAVNIGAAGSRAIGPAGAAIRHVGATCDLVAHGSILLFAAERRLVRDIRPGRNRGIGDTFPAVVGR